MCLLKIMPLKWKLNIRQYYQSVNESKPNYQVLTTTFHCIFFLQKSEAHTYTHGHIHPVTEPHQD